MMYRGFTGIVTPRRAVSGVALLFTVSFVINTWQNLSLGSSRQPANEPMLLNVFSIPAAAFGAKWGQRRSSFRPKQRIAR